jgi:DNA-binding Lrp family transcriptional regulator
MDELLKLLRKNALETPQNLAQQLDTTEAEVKRRVADYEAAGIILGYQAVVNEELLELQRVRAMIEIRITPERGGGYDRIANRIGKFPEVASLYLMSGAYDLLAIVTGPDLRTVASFVNQRLATIEGVLSVATHFGLKTYKDQGILMETEQEHERLSVSP